MKKKESFHKTRSERKKLSLSADIELGAKYRATERLMSIIQARPYDLSLREKLAEIYFEAGFLDAAGRYWLLTEVDSDEVRRCVEIYKQSVNNSPVRILRDLFFRGDKELLPANLKQVLEELENECIHKGEPIPKFEPWNQPKRESKQKRSLIEYVVLGLIAGGGLLLIAFLLIGVNTVFSWIFD